MVQVSAPDGKGSGKEWSFRSKILAIIFVVVASLLNWVFRWEVEQGSILAVGGFIAATFLPVDISKIRQAGRQGS